MYDELIKNLRKMQSHEYCVLVSIDGFPAMQTVKQAADAIEELQKDLERSKDFEAFWQHEAEEALKKFQVAISNKPRWIPVTQRLPEHNGDYLVYSVVGNWEQLSKIEIAFWNDKNFIVQSFFAVTHWMPLPSNEMQIDLIGDGKQCKQAKQTNADRIRSMTDEEFATAICKHDGCPFREAEDDECFKHHFDCKACWLDWLKQECDDNGT